MRLIIAVLVLCSSGFAADLDWRQVNQETLKHFQALVRMNTCDPPGGETPAAEYLRSVLQENAIPVQVFTLLPNRPRRHRGSTPRCTARWRRPADNSIQEQ